MIARGTWFAEHTGRIALSAILLVLLSVADGYFCGAEAQAHSNLSISLDDEGQVDDGDDDADCAYGHCHHVVPMTAPTQAVVAPARHSSVDLRLTPVLHSVDRSSLDRPPKA